MTDQIVTLSLVGAPTEAWPEGKPNPIHDCTICGRPVVGAARRTPAGYAHADDALWHAGLQPGLYGQEV